MDPRAEDSQKTRAAAPPPSARLAPPASARLAPPASARLAPAAPVGDVRARLARACRDVLARDPGFAPLSDVLLERVDELGRGGMGVVYRVRDRRLDREAALKVILGGAGSGSGPVAHHERTVRRFQREVRLTARLEHPSIPPVYG